MFWETQNEAVITDTGVKHADHTKVLHECSTVQQPDVRGSQKSLSINLYNVHILVHIFYMQVILFYYVKIVM